MTIKSNVTELAAKIQAELTVTDGAIVDTTQYVANLPEGVTKEQVEAIRSHDTLYTAAFVHAASKKTFEAMQANSELNQVTATSDIIDGTVSATIQRSVERPVPGKDEKVTVKGATSVKLSLKAGQNKGQMGQVITENKSLFASL